MNYVAKGVKWVFGGNNNKPEAKTEDPGARKINYNDVNEGLNTIMTSKKPLAEVVAIEHGEDNNDNKQEDNNDNKQKDNNDNNKEENKEQQILKRDAEKKAQEYAEKSLKQMINGEELLTNMETFMESIRNLPENIYEKNFENYAIVLSNTTINGEKIFNDVEEAKQFINKIRNGAKTPKRYIKPRAYKQFKQEIQKQLQLTPMISRSVKRRTNAINVYQY